MFYSSKSVVPLPVIPAAPNYPPPIPPRTSKSHNQSVDTPKPKPISSPMRNPLSEIRRNHSPPKHIEHDDHTPSFLTDGKIKLFKRVGEESDKGTNISEEKKEETTEEDTEKKEIVEYEEEENSIHQEPCLSHMSLYKIKDPKYHLSSSDFCTTHVRDTYYRTKLHRDLENQYNVHVDTQSQEHLPLSNKRENRYSHRIVQPTTTDRICLYIMYFSSGSTVIIMGGVIFLLVKLFA